MTNSETGDGESMTNSETGHKQAIIPPQKALLRKEPIFHYQQ